jgi:hypothetical protein
VKEDAGMPSAESPLFVVCRGTDGKHFLVRKKTANPPTSWESALAQSAMKWEFIDSWYKEHSHKLEDGAGSTCALCLFRKKDDECPVAQAVNAGEDCNDCENTMYMRYAEEMRKPAREGVYEALSAFARAEAWFLWTIIDTTDSMEHKGPEGHEILRKREGEEHEGRERRAEEEAERETLPALEASTNMRWRRTLLIDTSIVRYGDTMPDSYPEIEGWKLDEVNYCCKYAYDVMELDNTSLHGNPKMSLLVADNDRDLHLTIENRYGDPLEVNYCPFCGAPVEIIVVRDRTWKALPPFYVEPKFELADTYARSRWDSHQG